MSSSSQHDDWRAQVFQTMTPVQREKLEQELTRRQDRKRLASLLLRFATVVLLGAGMVWLTGFAWVFAVVLVAWLLLWPR